MAPLGNLAPADFIARFWQREPLLISAALPDCVDLIDGDTLAGLACEVDAEARLVIGDDDDWRCEHGPFDASRFNSLPDRRWTLLVQSVDQWIPEVALLLDRFDFLPRWRLDDIMISYATDGGGVGPHFDYYDVFLLQLAGEREWQTGEQCDEQTPLRDHDELRLLATFDAEKTHRLAPGDMLYVPAGRAHCGTAIGSHCVTASIGFRAPSHRELLLDATEDVTANWNDNLRFRDSSTSIDSDPYCINNAVVEQTRIDLAKHRRYGTARADCQKPDSRVGYAGHRTALPATNRSKQKCIGESRTIFASQRISQMSTSSVKPVRLRVS